MLFRFIGDVHGKLSEYNKIISAGDYDISVQVGDLGFSYNEQLMGDPSKNMVIGGNHDNYDHLTKHFLDGYGVIRGFGESFFVRGAESIDRKRRTAGFNWFYQEQIHSRFYDNIVALYEAIKPSVMVTHTCPAFLANSIGGRLPQEYGYPEGWSDQTSHLLEHLYKLHQPKLWVFGHFHKSITADVGRTRFRCLAELEVFDVESVDFLPA